MKAYGGVDAYIHLFWTSAQVGGDWSASRPGRFTPGERVPSTNWMGTRSGLDDVGDEKSRPYRYSNSDPSAVQPVVSRYTDYAIPARQYR
jgi:hypothetical protein